jgi:hypothetical protein
MCEKKKQSIILSSFILNLEIIEHLEYLIKMIKMIKVIEIKLGNN